MVWAECYWQSTRFDSLSPAWQGMTDFTSIYERYSGDVFRFALYLSGNRTDADDITSETFARAWAASDSIQVETVKGYLFAIAKNLFLKGIQRAKNYDAKDYDVPDASPSALEVVERREEVGAVLEAMQELAPIDRAALIMRTLHDLPYAEIARILDITEGAAKVKVHRSRASLMKLRRI